MTDLLLILLALFLRDEQTDSLDASTAVKPIQLDLLGKDAQVEDNALWSCRCDDAVNNSRKTFSVARCDECGAVRPTFCVYLHTAAPSPNRSGYVGYTEKGIVHRWNKGHLNRKSGCLALVNAIKKYGPENFEHRILAWHRTKKDARAGEIFWIVRLGTHVSVEGYNITWGGEGSRGLKQSIQARERMSKAWDRRRVEYPTTPETRKKISDRGRGRLVKTSTREKQSEANRGHRHSPETRFKISAAVVNQSDETRTRKSIAAKNRPPVSEETKTRHRETAIKRWRDGAFRKSHGRTVLSANDVREIRLAASVGAKHVSQARLYGVSGMTISRIVRRLERDDVT